jgi:hypothetical protein
MVGVTEIVAIVAEGVETIAVGEIGDGIAGTGAEVADCSKGTRKGKNGIL